MRLLLQSGAEPSLAAEDGCTALMAAALARSKECVTLLLDAGADVGARNADGRTVLDELERRDGQVGLITMCAGGGMAPAIIIERV